ncbi:MAG: hypothetical protein EA359_16435 [Balneolaceae bacterium]|nr:MAG: hypothetical protein EA359_16435 [Balneolaceae bacterium]
MKNLILSLYLLVPLLAYSQPPGIQQNCENWIEKGHKAIINQEAELALDIWADARTHLTEPCLALSVEYIRLVTEQNMKPYYELAFSMYVWGLSSENIELNANALVKEIEHMKPIAEIEEYRRWKKMLDERNPDLFSELHDFWDRKNYIPDFNYNPRLLEHWERLAYIYRNFAGDETTDILTDPRSVIYLRFGEPDNGRQIMDLSIQPEEVERFVTTWVAMQGGSPMRAQSLTGNISDRMSEYEQHTEIEMWRYHSTHVNSMRDLTLFFQKQEDGTYQRISTLHNLIPRRAYGRQAISRVARESYEQQQRSAQSTVSISPGLVMQYLYHAKLRSVDPYFTNRTALMEDQFYRFSENYSITPDDDDQAELVFISSAYFGQELHFRDRYRAERYLASAETEISTSREYLPEIPVEVFQYRMLDQHNRPVYATFVESNPIPAMYADYTSWDINSAAIEGDFTSLELDYREVYSLKHILQRRDANGLPLGITEHESVIMTDRDSRATSVFLVPVVTEPVRQFIYARLDNKLAPESRLLASANPVQLRGLGVKEFTQPPHFDAGPNILAASDLIIGYSRDLEAKDGLFFPFIVSNQKTIPYGENLAVHFEVYHLETDEQGFSRFEVDYSITSRSGFLNLFRRDVIDGKMNLSFEHMGSRFAESLELVTEELQPDTYQLEFQIRDLIRGQTVSRAVQFMVDEQGQSDSLTSLDESVF